MADCRETLAELETYLDEELGADRSREIIEHLKGCTDCQGAFEFHFELRVAVRRQAQTDRMSEGFLDRLKGCFGDDVLGDGDGSDRSGVA